MLEPIYQNVRDLGTLLGKTIAADQGEQWLINIEAVRLEGKELAAGDSKAITALQNHFAQSNEHDLLIYARAFSQFLNLVNLAEQQYTTSTDGLAELDLAHPLADLESKIVNSDPALITTALKKLRIELVLTAHPTEVNRRTFIHKYKQIGQALGNTNDIDFTRIEELITQAWHTDEIRHQRPTPLDESRWGLNSIADNFWQAVPVFMRELDDFSLKMTGQPLPQDATPITMASWMAGDRDGNPFVTATLSKEALINARLMACELYLKDFEDLYLELSMSKATDDLICEDNSIQGPYRQHLMPVIRLLKDAQEALKEGRTDNILSSSEQLRKPLQLCRDSLLAVGLTSVANSLVLDLIRKVNSFGISLVKLDIRQHSERHDSALAELTQVLNLGTYTDWPEEERQEFLLAELNNPRPLIPKHQWTEDTQEVFDTFNMIAQEPAELFGLYVISMASKVSDVLAVKLLLKAAGVSWNMPIAPLFETLDDLNNAPQIMSALLNIENYRNTCNQQHNVMIGYSDSSKDAGVLAATWAQYKCQEKLVEVFVEQNIELKLFHGRGGTIGRGGGPAHDAIASQPPGTLDGGLRVTEQGETIRYKFGTPSLAIRSLHLYASAIVECLITPPPTPKQTWRDIMEIMSEESCNTYRQYVQGNDDFVKYFRQATPEQELASLPLGSRPSKRKSDGGIESLRAIPWIFAWSQNRLVVPSWLGLGSAIKSAYQTNAQLIEEMLKQWPYFRSRISLTEMVYSKTDSKMSALYDFSLVEDSLKVMGEELREQLTQDKQTLLSILGQKVALEHDQWNLNSFELRRPYLAPLHLLQIEALKRLRAEPEHMENKLVLMVTMAGIATGMRNTG